MYVRHTHHSHKRPKWIVSATVFSTLVLSGAAGLATIGGPAHAQTEVLEAPNMRTPGDFQAPALRAPLGSQPAITSEALPGVGPRTFGQIPADTDQVIVATSAHPGDTRAHITLYQRSGSGWDRTLSVKGHIGKSGWKHNRSEGDESTPTGVYTLTDAGGYLPNPGTAMPYTRDKHLRSGASQAYSRAVHNVFDYVLAIDFNRKPGTPPTDSTRPQGKKIGGGIWMHVDHGSPTHGCVTVSKTSMSTLLKQLNPEHRPVIIMGDAAFIAQ